MAYRRYHPPLHSVDPDARANVVATWYMKTILPYQGWALINLWIWLVRICGFPLCSFCLISANRYPDPLCGTVLLGVRRIWTALMGFLQLLIGRDKYSISRQQLAMNH